MFFGEIVRAIEIDNKFTLLSNKFDIHMTKESYVLLSNLKIGLDPANITNCALVVNRDITTVSRLVKRLLKLKLVTYKAGLSDTRCRFVTITELGSDTVKKFYINLEN